MLHFITGKVGCGKTVYTHKLIGKLVSEKDAKVMLIVPKQFTFESDAGILDVLGPRLAGNVDVLSFSRLADTVLKTCRGIRKPALSDGANCIIMGLALESVKDRLKFFSRHYNNISFINKMILQVKEFKRNSLTALDVELAAKRMPEGLLHQKATETALIYRTYDALVEKSFYDDADLLTIVYEILLDYDEFFKGKTVFIDDFSSFSVQELKLISLMMKYADDVYVTACTDDSKNTDESSCFAVVNRMLRKLESKACEAGVDIAREIKLTDRLNGFDAYRFEELRFLEENLYKADAKTYDRTAQAVSLCCAPSIREECDFVARTIRKFMRTGEYRCRDMAVVYRNEDPYAREIRYSLKKYGVPIFEDKRQPIINEPLVVFVRALMDICACGFSTQSIMRILKTGLAGFDRDDTAKLENYALMWDLDGKDWIRTWTDDPNGFGREMNDSGEQELALLNELREKATAPIFLLREKIKGANGREAMTFVYEYLCENEINESLKTYAIELEKSGCIELAIEQEQIWDIVMDTFDRIAVTLDENVVSAKRLCEIFDLVISTQSLGKLPDGFDEVYICGCDRIATIMPKVIFAVGVNDGKFPLPYCESGVFGDFEKDKLRAFLPELSDGAQLGNMNERFMVYNTLCSARERLFVTWALAENSGEKLTESEIVLKLKRLLPLAVRINTREQSVSELVESEASAFELMAEKWNDDTDEAKTLKAYFYSKEEYKGRLEAIERAVSKRTFKIEDKDTATAIFGKNINLSASKLEDYGNCPFKFFCKYALRAKPRQIARLDPAQSGTLVHYILEKLLKNHSGKSFLNVPEQELDRELESLLDSYIETKMGGAKDKSKRFLYLYSRTLKILRAIVERLLFEFSESDFEPCDFELNIEWGDDNSIKPFRVELDEGYIELHGEVDRVDKMDKNSKRYIRVVDYKTGEKEFLLSDVLGGLNMQMLLYLVSIWRGGKKHYGENIVPAGVLYSPVRLEPYEVDRNDDEQIRRMKRITGGKMDGMILSQDDVIESMDKGASYMIIPIKKGSKGGLSGKFITLGQLGKLAKKMDEIMAQMGNELHAGHIPALPVYGKKHDNTCGKCDFSGICVRRENSDVRYLQYRSHAECIGLIEGGEEQ